MKYPVLKVFLVLILLASFQNCSPFEALKLSSSLSGGSLSSASDSFAAKLRDTKSVTIYDIKDVLRDPARVDRDIKKIKDLGLNTVWIVVTWQSLEASVGKNSQYEIGAPGYDGRINNQNIQQVKSILASFKKNDLNVIWSLDYLGEGWAPEGVHAHRLTAGDDRLYFLRYARFVARLIKEANMEENVFLLFHDEGILAPYDTLHADLEIQQAYRNFLFARNSNLSFWNAKWKTSYSDWSLVKTFSFHSAGYDDPRLQETVRFINTEIRNNISKYLKAEINNIIPKAKVGFHYTNFSFVNHRQEDWQNNQDLPFQSNIDYDFISLAFYDVSAPWAFRPTSASEYLNAVKKHTSTELFFFGELGSAVCENNCSIQGSKTVAGGTVLSRQANFLKRSITELLSAGVGFNLWNLQDFDFAQSKNGSFQISTEGLFGLYNTSGALKPSGSTVLALLKNPPSQQTPCDNSAANPCSPPSSSGGNNATPPNTPVLPAPLVQNFGPGCEAGNCIWVIGKNLRPGCRADIYNEDGSGLHSSVTAICQNSSGTFEIPAALFNAKKNFYFTIVNSDDGQWSPAALYKFK